jgi:DNA-directed RNA polymerase specialized sigma24 family protein
MTEIYSEIATLTDKFRTMAYGLTTDENKVNEAVQELMLYFLQANPSVIKSIYEKDGILGITRYGAVALRRALTSTRSNFYYKYEKYYTHIDSSVYSASSTNVDDYIISDDWNYKNISNLPNEEIDNAHNKKLDKLEKIDKVLDTLYWYDTKIFQLYYYEGNTLDSLAAKTRISRNSLFTTIDKVRTILKKELNEDV